MNTVNNLSVDTLIDLRDYIAAQIDEITPERGTVMVGRHLFVDEVAGHGGATRYRVVVWSHDLPRDREWTDDEIEESGWEEPIATTDSSRDAAELAVLAWLMQERIVGVRASLADPERLAPVIGMHAFLGFEAALVELLERRMAA